MDFSHYEPLQRERSMEFCLYFIDMILDRSHEMKHYDEEDLEKLQKAWDTYHLAKGNMMPTTK